MNRAHQRLELITSRDLTRSDANIALLGIAHVLKLTFLHVGSHQDLAMFKETLLRKVKNATMDERKVHNEIAVLDTIIDLVEVAYALAEQSPTGSPTARPGPC